MTRFGFIGAGQMAKALASGIATVDSQSKFLISDPAPAARETFVVNLGADRTSIASSNQEVFEESDTVFLAVKPQFFEAALEGVELDLQAQPLIISVMAGIPISRIAARTGIERVVRVMPNTPCLVGQGTCGISVPAEVSDEDIELVKALLEPIGLVVIVPEPMLDSVTGLSGSGPAFVFAFMESLIAGAERTGMPTDIAQELAIQTVFGAAVLVKETGESIATLRERVTSPGGTTLAGLTALKENGFHEAVISAVEAATARSRELGNG